MRSWFHGKRGGLVAFLGIAALVAGGLGWVTAAALRLEREQLEGQARADDDDRLRLAMWKLEARVAPTLAIEDNRPYNHYSPIFATARALVKHGDVWQVDTVLEPSPLLDAQLPDWILLHFQSDAGGSWSSPEIVPGKLGQRLMQCQIEVTPTSPTPKQLQLFQELKAHWQPIDLLAQVRSRGEQLALAETTLEIPNFNQTFADNTTNTNLSLFPVQQAFPAQQAVRETQAGYQGRAMQQNRVQNEGKGMPSKESKVLRGGNLRDPEAWFARGQLRVSPDDWVNVNRGPLVRFWLTTANQADRLVAVRLVQVGEREVCQGLALDWERLQQVLAQEVADLLPDVRFEPMRDAAPPHPERTMINLPIEVIPAKEVLALTDPGWTPLRVGLALAWAAAVLALAAVGLGSWSLLDLSERRIRFVSAVTHELRTPLTTLRLYLDMLNGGLVRDERQKDEYLHTLHSEAERLHRLIANVLDFSRLEDQRPRLVKSTVELNQLLEQIRATWQARCQDAGKELIVESSADGVRVETDPELTQQILGNLIDNACKYSRSAADRRIWLRARLAAGEQVVIEVEDRGPGVAARERRSIFRPFRRGDGTDTIGGVGLGLALAQRWARLLGGQLSLRQSGDAGACFQLELPLQQANH